MIHRTGHFRETGEMMIDFKHLRKNCIWRAEVRIRRVTIGDAPTIITHNYIIVKKKKCTKKGSFLVKTAQNRQII